MNAGFGFRFAFFFAGAFFIAFFFGFAAFFLAFFFAAILVLLAVGRRAVIAFTNVSDAQKLKSLVRRAIGKRVFHWEKHDFSQFFHCVLPVVAVVVRVS